MGGWESTYLLPGWITHRKGYYVVCSGKQLHYWTLFFWRKWCNSDNQLWLLLKYAAKFFLPQLQNKAPDILGNMWFQQDGAKCYTIQPVMAFLRQTFGNRIISWFSDVPGPHQSLHLTAPEFFLRGYLKEQVYRRHPHTQLQLAHRIQHANEAITDNTLVAAMNNVIHQCYSCANS